MQMDPDQIKYLARQRGLTLTALLNNAGVSRTAFYHLIKQSSVLPDSVEKLAHTLQVSPLKLLSEQSLEAQKIRIVRKQLEVLMRKNPSLNPDTAWHTLLLLSKKPIERIERALRRGRNSYIWKK